ncbi:MAG: DUF5060 domain-containing protein [Bdellovibrionales bacterium]|nr:DUF5060 domain-containing protein [Bdellovibrionales bacterium]
MISCLIIFGTLLTACESKIGVVVDSGEISALIDECPDDPSKLFPGVCGCGVPDIDSDEDSVFDCQDMCAFDSSKIFPEPEICDGLDNDCDGTIDEGCGCVDGSVQVCGSNVGQCSQGSQMCVGGMWSTCNDVGPSMEVCDGLDNDCDTLVDESAVCNSPLPQIAKLVVYNADTDQVIAAFDPLTEGANIDLGVVGSNINILAMTQPTTVGSVVFGLDGNSSYRTETSAPYALAGDTAGDLKPWTPSVGSHTVSATAYTQSGGAGQAGPTLSITFQVSNNTVVTNMAPTANAGPNVVENNPSATVVLNGSGSDSDGTIVSYQWAKVSGPSITMSGANTATLTLSTLVMNSNYLFELTVTDDQGATATDTAMLTVGSPTSSTVISGELRQWHTVTMTYQGPSTSENANPNPFLQYRLQVVFTGPSMQTYNVPGFYAADGDAADSSANSGSKWKVHFRPDEVGTWTYTTSFRMGTNIAVNDNASAGSSAGFFDGDSGSFVVASTNKMAPDFRAKGRLSYVGDHYLRFANGDRFLKAGSDSPETFLAYHGFDQTSTNQSSAPVKTYQAHVSDWTSGDPTWEGGSSGGQEGKGIIGALNYLNSEGMNAFSFLTMNVNGDGKNVWPWTGYSVRDRYDVSKLEQWNIVFTHGQNLGMYLHFKTQETENDQLLNNGSLGVERKLYYRELIARFGHHLGLNWNLGEENTQTAQQQKDMAQYFYDHDPYQSHIVMHTYSTQHNLYNSLTGNQSKLTGASIQTGRGKVHADTILWRNESANQGKPWVVASDEIGPANVGVSPDPGWPGYTGTGNHKAVRWQALWGNLMGGGAGVEFYYGYSNPQNDLDCEDFRSRDQMWDYARYAIGFFHTYLDFWNMENCDDLVDDPNYCFGDVGDTYVIYLPNGGSTDLDLQNSNQSFSVQWFNPRTGGSLQNGSVTQITGTGKQSIGQAPSQTGEDWAILIQKI